MPSFMNSTLNEKWLSHIAPFVADELRILGDCLYPCLFEVDMCAVGLLSISLLLFIVMDFICATLICCSFLSRHHVHNTTQTGSYSLFNWTHR